MLLLGSGKRVGLGEHEEPLLVGYVPLDAVLRDECAQHALKLVEILQLVSLHLPSTRSRLLAAAVLTHRPHDLHHGHEAHARRGHVPIHLGEEVSVDPEARLLQHQVDADADEALAVRVQRAVVQGQVARVQRVGQRAQLVQLVGRGEQRRGECTQSELEYVDQ